MNRREARELLFTLVFEYEFKKNEDHSTLYADALINREFEEDEYVKNSFEGIIENLEMVDGKISAYSEGWSINRISKVSLAAMRVAVYEIFMCEDIPSSVSINEAIELVKKYDEDKSPKFVNGVLNAIASNKENN